MELGWSPLTIHDETLADLRGLPVLHWYCDNIVPPETVVLASTPHCPVQAFALGDYALGLQFHLEIQAAQFERWLIGHIGDLRRQGVDCPFALRNGGALPTVVGGCAGRISCVDWVGGAALSA